MAQVSVAFQRMRHLRHRALDGLDRGFLGGQGGGPGVPRLKKLGSYLDDRETALGGTGTSQTFTANDATDELTVTGHGYSNGSGPLEVSNSGGALPSGLTEDTNYWASVVDVNTIQLHTSWAEATQGNNPVDFTDAGSGTNSIVPRTAARSLPEHLRQGLSAEELRDETDIDNLV